jgi:hypothetical protein
MRHLLKGCWSKAVYVARRNHPDLEDMLGDKTLTAQKLNIITFLELHQNGSPLASKARFRSRVSVVH